MTIIESSDITDGDGVSVIGDGFAEVAASSQAATYDYNGYDYTDGDDVITGTGNDDDIRGGAGNDTLTGLGGDDRLEGGDGDDSLNGGSGSDTIVGDDYWGYGEGGNDTLIGGDGADWMVGGRGNDSLVGGNGDDGLQGGLGADTLTGGGGTDDFSFRCGTFYNGEITDLSPDEFDGDEITDLSPGDYLVFLSVIFTQTDVIRTDDADSTRLDIDIDGDGFSDGTITFSSRVTQSLGVVMTGGNEYGAPFTVIGTTSSSLGTANDDTLQGDSDPDVIGGGDGDDSVSGGGGSDHLGGDGGDDTLSGEAGNDSLYGGAGDDIVIGGDGDDYIGYGSGNDTLDGAAGADGLYGGVGDDVLQCGSGDDHAIGGDGNDLIIAGDGNDGELNGNAGNDTIYGGSGNDRSYGGDENDVIFGGDGNDTLNGGWENYGYYSDAGDDSMDGGAGSDRLYMESGNDTLRGGAGNDIFQTTGSYRDNEAMIADLAVGDQIRVSSYGYGSRTQFLGVDPGDEQTDVLMFDVDGDGASDRSIIVGGHFTKDMFKAAYNESPSSSSLIIQLKQASLAVTIAGDDGDNFLESLNGNNTVDGAGGNDTLISGAGNDSLQGGAGSDWASFAPFSSAVTANLATGKASSTDSGTDTLTEIENIQGGYGNDTLTGDDRANTLCGGAGADSLTGGSGYDTFLYTSASQSTASAGDVIAVFDSPGGAAGDLIDVSAFGPFAFIGTQDFSGTDQLRVAQSGRDALIQIDIDGNGAADWQVKVLNATAASFTDSDFVGTAPDQTLIGTGGNNVLDGRDGDDHLVGGSGADTLLGGDGDDVLYGGARGDVLTGGAGADVFKFADWLHSRPTAEDKITDFQQGVDRIDLTGVDAVKFGGNDAFTFIGGEAEFTAAGQLRAVQDGDDVLIQGDTTGAGQADFQVRVLNASAADFTADDFFL